MNSNTRKIYISELVILLAVLILLFTINKPLYTFRNICIIMSLGIALVILLECFGWRKDNSYIKKYSTRTLISLMMSYIILIYGLGIILGFTRGFKAINYQFFINLIVTIVYVIETETVRYLVSKNSLDSKIPLIVFTILSIFLSVLLEINISNLTTAEEKFIFLSTIIFPTIAQESLCSFMTNKISLRLSLIYKFVIKLYYYVLPIVPNMGDYIYSSVNVLYPYLIYIFLNKIIVKYEKIKANFRKTNITIFSIPLLLFLVLLIILVSGVSRYTMIAIASNSMHPTYDRGDAIIFKKVDPESIEVGDILTFTKEDKIITHRVVKRFYSKKGYCFNTKGDNNETQDAFNTCESNVLGKVTFSFKYIGYPTVILNEIFGKE